MNPSSQYPHRRRLTRAEARRRRRNRAIRRVAGLTLVACVLVGGVSFLLHRKAPVPAASASPPVAASSMAATNGLFGKTRRLLLPVSSEPAAPDNALGRRRRPAPCWPTRDGAGEPRQQDAGQLHV